MKHVRERRCLRESSAENERGLCQWDYACSCASRGPRGPTTGPPGPPGLVWHQCGSVNGPRLGVPFPRVVWGHCHSGRFLQVPDGPGNVTIDGPGTRIAVPGLGVGISGILRELLIPGAGIPAPIFFCECQWAGQHAKCRWVVAFLWWLASSGAN
jgi:hypothetical protein